MKTNLKHMSRRTVIRSAAALGLLPSLGAERLLAATTEAPLRIAIIPIQHGWGISGLSNRNMSGSEGDFAFPEGLEPLNDIRPQCTVIDGLLTLGLWGNNHDLSYADMLTAGVPVGEKSSSFDSHMPLSVSPSIDYLLEEASSKAAYRFSAGYRSWGASFNPLSFDRRGTILPYFTKASDAYSSIFSALDGVDVTAGVGSASEVNVLREVLKFIKTPAQADLSRLRPEEKAKLERYLLAVENQEGKQASEVEYSGSVRLDSKPAVGQAKLDDLADYLDMVRVGFANDFTRCAVVGIGDINLIPHFHHDHAHANDDIYWGTRRGFSQTIVNFARSLDAVEDFDGSTLLDNTIIVLTGEVGDGSHDVLNKGHILIGGKNHIATGRYLKQDIVQGATNIQALRREDIHGALQPQVTFGNMNNQIAGTRTNADLWRELGNLAGLSLSEFGFASQNKGDLGL